MKTIRKEKIDKNIQSLLIRKFDIYNNEGDKKILVDIIKILTKGKLFYFNFRREEGFLDDDENNYYRQYIPEYFSKNGTYKYLYKSCEEVFDSIGMLPVNNDTFAFIVDLWQYFWSMAFYSPGIDLDWGIFVEFSKENFSDIGGKKLLESGLTESLFIRGHDGVSLYFNYVEDRYNLPDLRGKFKDVALQ